MFALASPNANRLSLFLPQTKTSPLLVKALEASSIIFNKGIFTCTRDFYNVKACEVLNFLRDRDETVENSETELTLII
jgi:hypothetical protein